MNNDEIVRIFVDSKNGNINAQKTIFNLMKESKDEIHPLILSSIFHYEFVFIHPFSDGNGRIARLWQNLILSKWKEIFEYVPIESQIKKYQEIIENVIKNRISAKKILKA